MDSYIQTISAEVFAHCVRTLESVLRPERKRGQLASCLTMHKICSRIFSAGRFDAGLFPPPIVGLVPEQPIMTLSVANVIKEAAAAHQHTNRYTTHIVKRGAAFLEECKLGLYLSGPGVLAPAW